MANYAFIVDLEQALPAFIFQKIYANLFIPNFAQTEDIDEKVLRPFYMTLKTPWLLHVTE